jgi:hypothetical protein
MGTKLHPRTGREDRHWKVCQSGGHGQLEASTTALFDPPHASGLLPAHNFRDTGCRRPERRPISHGSISAVDPEDM